MSSSPPATLSSPLSDLGSVAFSADGSFVDSFLQGPPSAANKAETNPPPESPVPPPDFITKKTGPKSESKSKPTSAEAVPRRRSTRISTVPSRFQPENSNNKPANTPEGNPSGTLPNTPTVLLITIPPGDSPATPTPKARAASNSINMSSLVWMEDIASISGPEGRNKKVSPTKGTETEHSAEIASPARGRSKRPKQEKQDILMIRSTNDSIFEAAPALPKRSHQKKKSAARKPKTPGKETTVTLDDTTPAPSSVTSTSRTHKRSLSEEPADSKRSRKKTNPKSLAVEASARRTRSQNASASAETAGTLMQSPVPDTPVSKAPALKKTVIRARVVKSLASGATYVTPRLSAMHFAAPLRAVVASATLHYSTLPTNLTDANAVSNLYRTFCALDTYREHLKVLGLEGDDKDVRGVMSQVWQLVNLGEKDENVVWKMLVANWSSQGANGWGNDGRV